MTHPESEDQPEFDSLESFIAHERSLLDDRTAEVVARAISEFTDAGVTVSPATKELLTARVQKCCPTDWTKRTKALKNDWETYESHVHRTPAASARSCRPGESFQTSTHAVAAGTT